MNRYIHSQTNEIFQNMKPKDGFKPTAAVSVFVLYFTNTKYML